jgi:hypothetical protein
MDDDRARHLEDKAGGIVGGDMSSVHDVIDSQNLYIYKRKANERERENGKRWCVL